MRIDPALAAAQGRATRRTRAACGGFTVPADMDDAEPAPEAAAAGQAAQLVCLAGIGAAATPPDTPAPSDAQAAGQARALLGALSGLHLAALGGDGAQARATLAELARVLPEAVSPGLDGVLRAIAQRAAIELARAG